MNKLEMISFLKAQVKNTSKTHDELVEIFENYKTMLLTLSKTDAAYSKSLQRLREEFPDIERIIGKKHDPILKGRLVDALTSFGKKVEEFEGIEDETPAIPETPADETKRVRNMPNLGMS